MSAASCGTTDSDSCRWRTACGKEGSNQRQVRFRSCISRTAEGASAALACDVGLHCGVAQQLSNWKPAGCSPAVRPESPGHLDGGCCHCLWRPPAAHIVAHKVAIRVQTWDMRNAHGIRAAVQHRQTQHVIAGKNRAAGSRILVSPDGLAR